MNWMGGSKIRAKKDLSGRATFFDEMRAKKRSKFDTPIASESNLVGDSTDLLSLHLASQAPHKKLVCSKQTSSTGFFQKQDTALDLTDPKNTATEASRYLSSLFCIIPFLV